MKFNSIITRYIFREMLAPFSLSVLFFMFVFLLSELLNITHMVVNYGIGITTVLWMIVYSMPYFMVYIVPMSVMMSVLLTFLTMSGDNEIIALKSGGVSLYQLLPPVLIFCTMGCLLTLWMLIQMLPWGNLSMKTATVEMARSHADIGLKEQTFNNNFKGLMLYVHKIDVKNKELIDVFIQDERTQGVILTVAAPRGKLIRDPEKLIFRIRLFGGWINQVNQENRSVNTVSFETYDLGLDLEKMGAGPGTGFKDEKEMTLRELQEYINHPDVKKDYRYYSILIEFHRKFSMPFACFALGIMALPLGIQSKTSRRSLGLLLGLFLFLFYYLMLSAAIVTGEAGLCPPAIGLWVPNIVTLLIGIYLLIRTVNGRPLYVEEFLPQWMRRWQKH